MFLLRRTAARAIAATPSSAVFVTPRSFSTIAPTAFRAKKQQWSLPAFQRRYLSGEPTKVETTEAEAIAVEEKEGFAQTAAEAPVEDNLIPAQEEAQAVPIEAPEDISKTQTPQRQRLRNVKPSKTLYVGNLYYEVNADQLKRIFGRFGEVENVRIIYDNRGLSRGFGYVEFKEMDHASAARESLDAQVFEGRNLVVDYNDSSRSKQRSPEGSSVQNPPSKTLFIGNMSYEMSDKDLNDLFRDIRNVMDVRVAIDRRTGQPRGFAHADFIDVASATQAKEVLSTKVLYGRNLRVDFSKTASPARTRESARD